ncbi:hypothetical protein FVEG_16357 [Fusarium verticillioides 7600]|uniref:Uncharacterized protein n=1 Tax=Gibberella moniliformis (strain M3125 / FGSC 7600) TaxID=334819 RepID=W7MN19_GIBM7|nr:hypothetical protein FVEG_16357 [Fusarium verticillioides 7600]EWG48925.1 hypothetical protein FVEG_16357 [Fusarium verticillioides 7600]
MLNTGQNWAEDLLGVLYSVVFAAGRLRRGSDGLFSLCRCPPASESAFELKGAHISQLRGKKSDVRVTLNSAPLRIPLRSGTSDAELNWTGDATSYCRMVANRNSKNRRTTPEVM